MTQNAAAGGNFRKDLTLSLHNLNEAGDKDASVSDQFDFVKVDPNDYEDYRDNKDAITNSFDGVSDAHGIVLSGGSTMYEGIVMSGGSTMYEGLTDRIVVEAARGNGEVGYEVDADMDGNDW
ncbi:MAG: hypothetical protein AAFV19_09655 [Pseudomonadota bacterium]